MSVTAYIREFETKMSTRLQPATPNAYALAISRATRDAAGDTIAKYIASERYSIAGLSVSYESTARILTVHGVARDQSTRDNVLACCRKIIGVARVVDRLTIAESPSLEARYQQLKVSGTTAR